MTKLLCSWINKIYKNKFVYSINRNGITSLAYADFPEVEGVFKVFVLLVDLKLSNFFFKFGSMTCIATVFVKNVSLHF